MKSVYKRCTKFDLVSTPKVKKTEPSFHPKSVQNLIQFPLLKSVQNLNQLPPLKCLNN
jgi:hypothetical protein